MINTERKRELRTKILISILLLVFMFLSFLFSDKIESALGMRIRYAKNETSSDNIKNFEYSVSYIDVGQGNSTLITLPDDKVVLIDGGNTMYGEIVYDYLCSFGVTKIDYLIASHADSDHIGGLNYLFDKFEIINIYRPFQIAGSGSNAETFVANAHEDLAIVYENYVSLTNNRAKISRVTSEVYNEFIKNIYTETYTEDGLEKDSKVTVFYDGLKISGENYEIEFFAPLIRDDVDLSLSTNTYGYPTVGYGTDNSNDNSAIFLFTCGIDTYLFTGDASWKSGGKDGTSSEDYEELDFVKSLTENDLSKISKVSVYLAGHHGSSHSSSSKLLEIINPKFVVISVGLGNIYGHPSSEVIFRLEKTKRLENDYLLRTDKSGSIVFGCFDGKLVYALENSIKDEILLISWEELACLLYLCMVAVIVFKKPIKFNKANFIDMKRK